LRCSSDKGLSGIGAYSPVKSSQKGRHVGWVGLLNEKSRRNYFSVAQSLKKLLRDDSDGTTQPASVNKKTALSGCGAIRRQSPGELCCGALV